VACRAPVIAACLATALGACASTHGGSDDQSKLAAARSALSKADASGNYTGVARTDLDAARHYLQQAEEARRNGQPRREVDSLAYAAEQLATAAMARQESMLLQDKEARDREAKLAQHRAETAEMEAERSRRLAQPAR
jgi:hypothetical protein